MFSGRLTVTTISLISARSSSLRSRSVVVFAAHSFGRSRARRVSASRSAAGERRGSGVLQRSERALLARDGGERVLELALQGPRDEPVLRLARVELALRALRVDLGALQRELLPGEPSVVLLGQLGDRAGARRDPGRSDRLEERRGDSPVQPPAAERLAGRSRCRAGETRARTRTGRGGRRCRNTRPASAGRTVRSAAGPAAARRPRARRRRPRRAVSRSPAGAGGWRGTPPR